MQEIFILLLSFNPELALTRLSIDQPGPDYNKLKWLNQVFRRLSGTRYVASQISLLIAHANMIQATLRRNENHYST